jgi:hypothetical protein
VAVQLVVQGAVGPPVLIASTANLNYSLIVGGVGITPNVLTQNILAHFSTAATPASSFNVGVHQVNGPSATWISAPASPINAGFTDVAVPVAINLAPLSPSGGSFSATVTLSAVAPATGTVTVPVTVNVAPQSVIGVNPSILTFNHTANVTFPSTQNTSVAITAPGPSGPHSFTAEVVNPSVTPWLLVNGGATASGTTPGSITLSYNPTGVPVGANTGQVKVTVPNATGNPATGNTVTINVTLNVSAAPLLHVPATAMLTGTGNPAQH